MTLLTVRQSPPFIYFFYRASPQSVPLQPSPTTAPISRCTTVLSSRFDAPTLRMHPAPVKPVAESSAISQNHSNAFSHQTGKEKQKAALEHPPQKNLPAKPHEAPMINVAAQRSENHLPPGQTNRYRNDPAPNQAGSFHLVGFSSLQQVLHHNQCQTSPAKQQREPRTILLSTRSNQQCNEYAAREVTYCTDTYGEGNMDCRSQRGRKHRSL